MSNEDKVAFIKNQVIANKLYLLSPVQYWLYFHWDGLYQDELALLHGELAERLEILCTSSKNCGVYLFCKMFESSSLKEQKKLLKSNVKDKILDLFEKNTNVVHFFIKAVVCFDDSVTLNQTVLLYICNNFINFLSTKEGLS